MASARYRGFTLIELLVVIAIIALLASLLLPTLAGAKATALSVKCKSNLRQLALGLQLYVQDNNGQYPAGYSIGMEGAKSWEELVGTELKRPQRPSKAEDAQSRGVFLCPAHKPVLKTNELVPSQTVSVGARSPAKREVIYTASYGYNHYGYTGGSTKRPDTQPTGLGGVVVRENSSDPGARVLPTRESQIKVSSAMLALGDGFHRFSQTSQIPGGATVNLEFIYESSGLGRGNYAYNDGVFVIVPLERVERRHRRRLNMAFCDGHVEDGRVHKWFYSVNDSDLRLWNADHEPK